MTTRAELLQLGDALLSARTTVDLLGQRNVAGLTAEERVDLDLQWQAAMDALMQANDAYTQGLRAHTLAQTRAVA